MNHIAFVFKSAPHGNSAGREGLDALLAVSTLTESVGVFFIGDGVFQILADQKPDKVLGRDYIVTFRVLPLYNIRIFRICSASLQERGLGKDRTFVLDVTILTSDELRKDLAGYHTILTF